MRRFLPILFAFLLCLPTSQSWEMGARMERRLVAATAGGSSNGLLTGLINYYYLDETTGTRADSVGSADLTDNGSVGYTTGADGNNAANFSGSNWLSMSGNPGFGATSGYPFSYSFWVQPASSTGNRQFLGFYDGTHLFQIGITSGALLRSVTGVSPFDAIADGTVSVGTWYHFVYTYSSAGVQKFYINNSLIGTDSTATGAFTASSDLNFGRRGGSANEYYTGAMQHVAYWEMELDATDVSVLYNSGTPLPLSSFD